MQNDIEIIKELYDAAEGATLDLAKFVSFFSDDGYVRNVPAGQEFRGKDIATVAGGMAVAFPDIHREIFNIYVMDGVVVVELAIRGTHTGDLATPAGVLPPSGNRIDVPCCDVFHVMDGKVVAFHCYNMASIMQQQLGLSG
ncbi:putative ester cyclase [Endobacter medicaginis]|uniref:Ester cyclase n=1 Tax=Endobacter medicaginis TaxID=1181271 RepID=A0A839V4Z2_9PROT|nr:ester cyclase [Endobacter medicaginis]MBB3175494.1 putative ester cyclase [Endobacter medicaginis]MCX5476991.1 ester cyclase [Endobacter medicaginis]NVN29011.1 ester cyclase [Endobacter medicaginis]